MPRSYHAGPIPYRGDDSQDYTDWECPPEGPGHNPKLEQFILRFGAVCVYCKRAGTVHGDPDKRRWARDHVIPRSKGGTNDPSNIVLCCNHCNSVKGWRPATYLLARLADEAAHG